MNIKIRKSSLEIFKTNFEIQKSKYVEYNVFCIAKQNETYKKVIFENELKIPLRVEKTTYDNGKKKESLPIYLLGAIIGNILLDHTYDTPKDEDWEKHYNKEKHFVKSGYSFISLTNILGSLEINDPKDNYNKDFKLLVEKLTENNHPFGPLTLKGNWEIIEKENNEGEDDEIDKYDTNDDTDIVQRRSKVILLIVPFLVILFASIFFRNQKSKKYKRDAVVNKAILTANDAYAKNNFLSAIHHAGTAFNLDSSSLNARSLLFKSYNNLKGKEFLESNFFRIPITNGLQPLNIENHIAGSNNILMVDAEFKRLTESYFSPIRKVTVEGSKYVPPKSSAFSVFNIELGCTVFKIHKGLILCDISMNSEKITSIWGKRDSVALETVPYTITAYDMQGNELQRSSLEGKYIHADIDERGIYIACLTSSENSNRVDIKDTYGNMINTLRKIPENAVKCKFLEGEKTKILVSNRSETWVIDYMSNEVLLVLDNMEKAILSSHGKLLTSKHQIVQTRLFQHKERGFYPVANDNLRRWNYFGQWTIYDLGTSEKILQVDSTYCRSSNHIWAFNRPLRNFYTVYNPRTNYELDFPHDSTFNKGYLSANDSIIYTCKSINSKGKDLSMVSVFDWNNHLTDTFKLNVPFYGIKRLSGEYIIAELGGLDFMNHKITIFENDGDSTSSILTGTSSVGDPRMFDQNNLLGRFDRHDNYNLFFRQVNFQPLGDSIDNLKNGFNINDYTKSNNFVPNQINPVVHNLIKQEGLKLGESHEDTVSFYLLNKDETILTIHDGAETIMKVNPNLKIYDYFYSTKHKRLIVFGCADGREDGPCIYQMYDSTGSLIFKDVFQEITQFLWQSYDLNRYVIFDWKNIKLLVKEIRGSKSFAAVEIPLKRDELTYFSTIVAINDTMIITSNYREESESFKGHIWKPNLILKRLESQIECMISPNNEE